MPELPEIETIRSGLSRFVLNKEIFAFKFFDKKLCPDCKANFRGDSFSMVERIGKLLVFSFKKSDLKLLIHLKMTGQLIFCNYKKIILAGGHSDKRKDDFNCDSLRHLRFEISFKDKDKLCLNDARRFAYLKIVNNVNFLEIKKRFGLEPLEKEFNFLSFSLLLEKRARKNIKAFLLDQSLIAGIGNIYADESLFASRISPLRKVASLNNKEKKSLFLNIKRILKLAVEKRGTTFSDYLDLEAKSGSFLRLLKVYARDGQKCKKCDSLVKKIRLVGRGTHYCPACQI